MENSSHASGSKYDVFISFRGIDVRHSFLSHLKNELRQKQIDAYVDDRLERGDEISPALLSAIEESLISLIIFSKDYASSKWCLEELVKIIECMHKNKQIVIPIFYNTDPSDVRHQRGSYGDALAEHEKHYKEKVQIWKFVLEKAANLSGFHSSNYGDEFELIKQIAKSLSTRLTTMFQSDTKDIVGIDERIADLESLMCQGSEDVRAIGIWGMGGIGKTTIATVIFNRFCFEYEGSCFMANVRDESEKYGIISLKNKIFSTLLKENDLHIGTPNGIPHYVKRRLLRKKALLVLDDVNDSIQLDNLVGALDCFGSGSRIIITTRDKQVLSKKVKKIYKVKPLIFDEAVQLFMLNAFEQTCLDMEWFKLSRRVINYAKGSPLALKILGSFLCGKSKEEWKSQLEKLKKMPYMEIHDVLRLSYDSLDEQEKSIFLYIACFFKGHPRCQIIELLDACDFSTTIGLKVLQDKALISWKSEMLFVSMHDLIREMGREIVRQESMENLGKHSHLWDSNDIYEVLKNDMGTEAIQSIILDASIYEELFLNPQVFARMHNLKFLQIFNLLPQGLVSFPKELRLLHWNGYPLKSLPSTFSAEKLVKLEMFGSRVEKLWDGVQCLVNLKKIDLRCSRYLLELPDFSGANNLEEAELYGCTNLRLVHPSILSLPKVRSLNLGYCKNITSLRSDIPSKALRMLYLSNCTKLNDFSVTSANMRQLYLSGTAITELPSSIGSLSNLKELNLDNCRNVMNLPSQLFDLRSPRNLRKINFENCLKLDEHLLHVIGLRVHLNLKNYAFKHSSPDDRGKIAGSLATVIYPGSKVPDWFMYRTSRASITIEPHSELQGFIFCVILRSSPSPIFYALVGCYLFLEDNNGRSRIRRGPPGGEDSLGTECFYVGNLISDHVVLWYDIFDCDYINERIQESRARNQLGTYPKISFEFLAFYEDPAKETTAVMKECGVYPVYASERNNFIEELKLELGNKTKRCRDIDELEPSEIRAKSSKLR